MSKTIKSRGRSPMSKVKGSSRLMGRNMQGGKMGPPSSDYSGGGMGGMGTKSAGMLGPKQRMAPRRKGMY